MVFHGNLGYSSIPEGHYPEVIAKCYWPILSLLEKHGIPAGFEFPGRTLEIIEEKDPNFIKRFKVLMTNKRVEFIGSGYVQSIFPLIPAAVNLKNLFLGNEVYQQILGLQPKIAFINEHVYADGLVKLYNQAGYEAIILDWVNAAHFNKDLKSCKYSATGIEGTDHQKIKVLWNNSFFFQLFQRYVYGDIDLVDYQKHVQSMKSKKESRVAMIYGNDMEVFNFRPRDPQILHSGDIKEDEIKKIERLLLMLKQDSDIEFVLPSQALDVCFLPHVFRIGTAESPITTKKQEKYNVSRWAVCGKNSYLSNTYCMQVYHELIADSKQTSFKDKDWKELVLLWASDFRTHTEPKKHAAFVTKLDELKKRLVTPPGITFPDITSSLIVRSNDRDMPSLHTHSVEQGVVTTDAVLLALSARKGAAIKKLTFKNVHNHPLIATLPYGYYDDITHAFDFFSGHCIILEGNQQITDLQSTKLDTREFDSFVEITAKVPLTQGAGTVDKLFRVYKKIPKVDVQLLFTFHRAINPTFARMMILTLNPHAFTKNKLFYRTSNGGFEEETYFFRKNFDQTLPVDFRFSARGCLGTTNEHLTIGDNQCALTIYADKTATYTVPLLTYERLSKSFFLRVSHSLIETDETTHCMLTGTLPLRFSLVAQPLKKTNRQQGSNR